MRKKLFNLFLLLVLSSMSVSAQLFEENKLTVGASYGFDIEKIGLMVGGRTLFTDNIGLDGNIIYFNYESGYAAEYNINGVYYFTENDFRPYALLGVNLSTSSFSYFGISSKGREFGLNIGGGLEYSLEKISFFVEPKYTLGGFDQLNASIGIRVNL